jgi:NAD+ synthase (glutamine-hydrolysing)
VKLGLAQINPTVGDFEGNKNRIIHYARQAAERGAELVLFPEMAVCGYPPADLLDKRDFVERSEETVDAIARAVPEIPIIVGFVQRSTEPTGKRVRNAAAYLTDGKVQFVQQKMLLPYYDVFDEQRYFEPAAKQELLPFDAEKMALTICEDAWNDKGFWLRPLYNVDPVGELLAAGATMVLNISASPFHRGKPALRQRMLAAVAETHGKVVAMVNQVGGNDGLVFDGNSVVLGPDGNVLGHAKAFEEDLLVVDTNGVSHPQATPTPEDELVDVYRALVLGTRDYVHKCGFQRAVIGLSGGIDSALVAAVAAEALGKENVLGVLMPSAYSSEGSVTDALALAANLGIRVEKIPIRGIFDTFDGTLAPLFTGMPRDLTEENIQSRIRGTLLMALSNKLGALVLTTGNKSEMSVGYCTLYGDMVGALAVVGDVWKTDVYRLSAYVNRDHEIIPSATLTKPPSAELSPGQKDTDSLPPYEILDPILKAYVEHYQQAEDIADKTRAPLELVKSVLKLVERSEYKRQQAAPVLKVTPKSFGPGRRFPIAAKVQV